MGNSFTSILHVPIISTSQTYETLSRCADSTTFGYHQVFGTPFTRKGKHYIFIYFLYTSSSVGFVDINHKYCLVQRINMKRIYFILFRLALDSILLEILISNQFSKRLTLQKSATVKKSHKRYGHIPS